MQVNVQFRPWEHESRGTMLCIDSYDNNVPVGRFYNLKCPDGVAFHGVIDLIKKMDAVLDDMRFPQPFSKIRTFADAPVLDTQAATMPIHQHGAVATFSVAILFRQNSSWQGSLAWVEGKREECFRSVLELLYLIDSAISSQDVGAQTKR